MSWAGDTGLALKGWVPSLARQWVVGADLDRCITGTLYFDAPIALATSRKRETHCAEVQIRPAALPPAPADHAYPAEALLFERTEGASLFFAVESPGALVHAELTANIPLSDFEALWERVASPQALWLTGKVAGADAGQPLVLDGKSVSRFVEELRFRVVEGGSLPKGYAATRATAQLLDALSSRYGSREWGNHVRDAAVELCTSAVANGADLSDLDTTFEFVRELLHGIRPRFRAPLNLSPGKGDDAYFLGPEDFAKAVATRGPEEARQLVAEYDTLWVHVNVINVVLTGEAKVGVQTQGFRPVVEELEELASRLLGNRSMHSATLEWAIVNALVYAECIAFAQRVMSDESMAGLPIAKELKGVPKGQSFLKGAGRTVANAAFEVLKVALTFVVAEGLAQGNTQSAWVITTGVTAARWIRMAIVADKTASSAQSPKSLLTKMGNVHELLKTRDFNARALREELYRVSAAGAVFSPWVFSLLDARIRREG